MYREHPAPRELRDVVEAFWTSSVAVPRPGRAHRVLPDGCVDVIVYLVGRPRVEVVGTMTRAIVVPEAASEIVAVRLRPGAAGAFFAGPADALTDGRAPAEALGLAAGPLLDALSASPTEEARVRHLAGVLAGRRRGGVDPLVARAVGALGSPQPPRVAELAEALGVSRQALTRRVRAAVGVGPKELARVLRVRRAAQALRAGRGDHAALAGELGFYDQAHFIHEMRALSGLTPGAYVRELAGTISPIAAADGVAHQAAEELPWTSSESPPCSSSSRSRTA